MKIKRLFLLSLATLTFLGFGSDTIKASFQSEVKNASPLEVTDDQYFGLGYSALEKYPIFNSVQAYHSGNPILNINNPEVKEILRSSLTRTDSSQSEFIGSTSTVLSKVAQEYGEKFGANVGANISVIKLDVGASFNTKTNFGEAAYEEYQYYLGVITNRIIKTTFSVDQLRNYLNPNFEADLYNANTKDRAKALFETYGTHMFSGYGLGGVLEITNYFASKSMAIERKNQTSIEAAFKAQQIAGANVSFESTYGSIDNTDSTVSNFKATFYGGKTTGAFSVDQLFELVGDNLGSNTKYRYEDWIDSLYNEKYDSQLSTYPTISTVPDNLKPIAVWDFLPNTAKYKEIRGVLYSTYAELAQDKYQEYMMNNPDKTRSYERVDAAVEVPVPSVSGISVQTYDQGTKTSYYQYEIPNENDNTYSVKKGSRISFQSNVDDFYGLDIQWKPQNNINDITVLDARNGVFDIGEDAGGIKFTFAPTIGGKKIAGSKNVIVNSQDEYFIGSGTESSPYQINSKQDLYALANDSSLWNKHYVLSNDITFTAADSQITIGNKGTEFTGTFDGQHHVLTNVPIGTVDQSLGLFAYNGGTIKNLKFKSPSTSVLHTVANHQTTSVEWERYSGSETLDGEVTKYNYLLYKPNVTNVKDVKYAGIATGYTTENSKVSNIFVENYDLQINSGINNNIRPGASKDIRDYMHVGGVIGYNQGDVEACSITNSKITATGYNFKYVSVGGVIGTQVNDNNQKKIQGIANCNSSVFGYLGDVSEKGSMDLEVYSGGLIGYMNGGQVVEGYVDFTKLQVASYSNNKGITGLIFGTNKVLVNRVDRGNMRVGGLAGYVNDGTIKNCILKDPSESSIKAIEAGDITPNGPQASDKTIVCQQNGYYKYNGIICGDYNTASGITEQFYNVYYSGINELNLYKTSTYISGVAREDSVKSGILSTYYTFGTNSYSIKETSIDKDSIYIDVTEAKTTFFIGEEFQCEGIKVFYKTTTDKTEQEVKTYKIDASQYSKEVEGTYDIKITAFDVTNSYEVTVVEPNGSHLEVEYTGTKTYYADDQFDDFGNLSIKFVKENGSSVVLEKKDVTIISKPFEEGFNDVEVHYVDKYKKEYKYIFSVEAKKRDITSFEITKTPSNTSFEVGKTLDNSDLAGIEATVHYKDENGVSNTYIETKVDKFEIINPKISVGDNEIILVYGDYLLARFHASGVYSDSTAASELETIVNKLDKTTNLTDMAKLIEEGQELVPYIETSISPTYATIVAKFNSYVSLYVTLVNKIEEVGTISNSYETYNTQQKVDNLIKYLTLVEEIGNYTNSNYVEYQVKLDAKVKELKAEFIAKVTSFINTTDYNEKLAMVNDILVYVPFVQKINDTDANTALQNFYTEKAKVEGELNKLVSDFVSLVNSISTKETLFEKFTAIKEALKIKEKLGDYNDENYKKACELLEKEIENYNNIVNDINTDIETGIQVSHSFMNTTIQAISISLLAIIAGILKKFVL